MLPVRFDPFSDIREWEKRFFPGVSSFFKDDEMGGFKPAVNTREGEYAYHVEVDLPGVKKEDIKVDITGNMLTISGERKPDTGVKDEDYRRVEIAYGSFYRSIMLPARLDTKNVEAVYEDGMLHITLQREAGAKSKKVNIQVKKGSV